MKVLQKNTTGSTPELEIFKGIDPKKVGTNDFIFLAALCCKKEKFTPDQAEELINTQEPRMNRPFRNNDVSRAVRNAYKLEGPKKSPRWPGINPRERAKIIARGHTVETLKATSPIPCLGANTPDDVERVVDLLFPGNPLLCVGSSKADCLTQEREKWRGRLAKLQFIVPSPMSARQGLNLDGEISNRCIDNTGPRRFLVIEQDKIDGVKIPLHEQAAVLIHLASLWPLALVCHSGSKSLHGFFLVHGKPEEKIEGFFRYAVSLGADRALWTRCQLARLPGGMRDNDRNQTILYFNPSVVK